MYFYINEAEKFVQQAGVDLIETRDFRMWQENDNERKRVFIRVYCNESSGRQKRTILLHVKL